jgi:hypothetical protein
MKPVLHVDGPERAVAEEVIIYEREAYFNGDSGVGYPTCTFHSLMIR